MTTRVIDARGLTCPKPVVLTGKALAETDRLITIVDNTAAVENVTRLARSKGFVVDVSETPDGMYLSIHKEGAAAASAMVENRTPMPVESNRGIGPIVLLVTSDCLGRGPEELGERLMGALFHTLLELSERPDTIVFMNTGVKLTTEGSRALEDLQALEALGIEILSCGTCLGYFELTNKLRAGRVSNMYEIAGRLMEAGKLVEF